MNRTFTKKESILILALTIVLIALAYYYFVYAPIRASIAGYESQTADLQTDIDVEQVRAMKIKNMQEEMEANKAISDAEVMTYDNLKEEINALNDIFGASEDFYFTFAKPVADGNAVRRNVTITFRASDYDTAEEIIEAIHNCKYRTLIKQTSLQPTTGNSNLLKDGVTCSMIVTFYETLYGAASRDGVE